MQGFGAHVVHAGAAPRAQMVLNPTAGRWRAPVGDKDVVSIGHMSGRANDRPAQGVKRGQTVGDASGAEKTSPRFNPPCGRAARFEPADLVVETLPNKPTEVSAPAVVFIVPDASPRTAYFESVVLALSVRFARSASFVTLSWGEVTAQG